MNIRKLRLGIIFYRNTIWISELYSILFVSALLISLVSIGTIITVNELQRYSLSNKVFALREDYSQLSDHRDILRGKYRIACALNGFTGGEFKPHTFEKIVNLVYENSTTYGYDPLLVLAVIHVESVFDPKAIGRYRSGMESGAFGLMQLKFATALEVASSIGVFLDDTTDLFKPEINIILGIAYLTQQISTFHDFKLGLLAYNQGPGTIQKHLKEKTPLSVRYYRKVLDRYYRLCTIVESCGIG